MFECFESLILRFERPSTRALFNYLWLFTIMTIGFREVDYINFYSVLFNYVWLFTIMTLGFREMLHYINSLNQDVLFNSIICYIFSNKIIL